MDQDENAPGMPSHSLPAGPPGAVPQASRPDVVSRTAGDRAKAAAASESKMAYAIATAAGAPIALLLLIPVLNQLGLLDVPAGVGASDVWSRGILVLVLLFVAVQLVSVLLGLEHRAAQATGKSRGRTMLAVWEARVGVLLAVAGAVFVACAGAPGWGSLALVGLAVEVVAIACLVWARKTEKKVELDVDVPEDARKPRVEVELPPEPNPALLAIGASGGGIRAASFVLGGHQAIQDVSTELGLDDPEAEPHVFAVSGGSYIAAALAMRRTFTAEGRVRGPDQGGAAPWGSSYATGSPELERLRRHTRYLFEPTWRTRDGITSLVMGAVANLFILGIVLRLLAWLSTQVAVSVGLVGDHRVDDRAELLDWAPAWDHWWEWWPVLGVPFLCLIGIAVWTFLGWRSTAAFDNTPDDDEPASEALAADRKARKRATLTLERASKWRTNLLFGGLGWLVVVVGLPALAVGLTHLTMTNQPTASAAAVLRSAGFATDERCAQAFEDRVKEAVQDANNLARLSPGAEQEVSTGACGLEVTVKRTVDPETLSVIGADEDAVRELAEDDSLPGQVAGVSVLLALVVALLRRGPSPEASVATTRRGRLKRALLTWLPLIIVTVLALYLVALWTFGFLVNMDRGYLIWSVVLTVAAGLLAFLVDANATSMHGFYRSRLSDAFAVGVDDTSGRARELPLGNVYRFSDLRKPSGTGPRLHIVTTLNSRFPNEAPTMRGGFPLVLGPEVVDVHRQEGRRVRVGTADYERYAGPGRVSIMAAVATSGAAISPLMGRLGAQMAPYRFLLALFNVRVGAWVRNPMHTGTAPALPLQRPGFLWMTDKPGLVQMALEAFGSSSADRRWVYLSDGGHLDNTGLVECVRKCVELGRGGRILVLEASNDPVDTWSAIGDAISVIRADLNLDLRRVDLAGQPPWMRRFEAAGLEVVVVKAVRTGPPAEDSEETDWWQVLPPNVQSFQLVNPDFPRASTIRQKFGDLEFEAYRGLGYASTRTALVAAGWAPAE